MRWLVLTLLALAASSVAMAEPYDEALAKRLGADEYGMKHYVLVILKTGPKTDLPKAEQDVLFRGHMANIGRLAAEGKLVIAGPLAKNAQTYRGIFVFNVAKVEEAELLVKSDPAVSAGVFAYEAFGWYGSAALQETTAIHNRIAKASP